MWVDWTDGVDPTQKTSPSCSANILEKLKDNQLRVLGGRVNLGWTNAPRGTNADNSYFKCKCQTIQSLK